MPGETMPDGVDGLVKRIRTIIPGLEIEQIERNQEGVINDVVIVNDQYVFRFARSAKFAGRFDAEIKILDLVRPQLGIDVPQPTSWGTDYMVYPLLKGKALTRKMVLSYDEDTQNQIAQQIGTFLFRLHTTDVLKAGWEIPATRAPARRQDWLDMWEEIKAKIYPLLQNYQIDWAEGFFTTALENPQFFEYKPALTHSDLAPYHLIFDEHACKITGVIDFGMAGIGDPATDIGGLMNIYGETFVNKIQKSYPDLQQYIPRARFYACAIEFEWILRGLETGETYWFTAHIASAKDIST